MTGELNNAQNSMVMIRKSQPNLQKYTCSVSWTSRVKPIAKVYDK